MHVEVIYWGNNICSGDIIFGSSIFVFLNSSTTRPPELSRSVSYFEMLVNRGSCEKYLTGNFFL